ncbi:uncharacterized protein Asalp_42620 [Aeromonas salmonicida subsp. pectinolytica 34mel]|uniref:Uncharacterized protein n=1 Tax=Aeromonas salmonicida subsp. pectinolytica 34mel TaxID=1324960 RepID=A0A2D1QLU3_AERSA|nr:uncharacterized protein Asalp_42620 [Aeromonas salmonicida subsp. pectinolytica 34mel]
MCGLYRLKILFHEYQSLDFKCISSYPTGNAPFHPALILSLLIHCRCNPNQRKKAALRGGPSCIPSHAPT